MPAERAHTACRLPRDAVRRLYWGSHSYHESAAVTTFGDHCSMPRTGLPDLFWNLSLEAPESVKPKATRVAEGLVRRHAAAMMLALRDGARSRAQLARAASLAAADANNLLSLLIALEDVKESGGQYTAVIPILTERDRAMVRELRVLGRRAMVKRMDERYQHLSADLAGLTPQRHGVPLAKSLWWVWHYVFGTANRELVAAGLFADPYDPRRTFKGFIPVVYRLNVVQGRF